MGRNIYTGVELLINVAPYKLHNREYAMYELEDLAARAGFVVAEKQWLNLGGGGGSMKKAARPLYYAATSLWPAFRSNLFIRATKNM
jgi:hypothetical protein